MRSNEEHLSRHSCADIFIDTFSWNANSTAIDSLWTGLPVVTLLGKSYQARTGASFLTTLGLTELIAHSEHEYETDDLLDKYMRTCFRTYKKTHVNC